MSLKIFSAVAQTLVLGDSPRELNGPLRMPLGPGFNLVFPQWCAATNLILRLVLLQDSRQSTVGSTHLFPGSILILLSWHSLAIFPTFYSLSPFHTCIPLLTSIPFLPLLLQLTLFHLWHYLTFSCSRTAINTLSFSVSPSRSVFSLPLSVV